MGERLADENDAASVQEGEFTQNSVRVIQKRLAAEKHPDFNDKDCLDCGESLPELRLLDGRIRCTACQTKLEFKRKKLFRG